MRRLLFAIILSFGITAPAAAQAKAWWGHVTTLADDSMRGRETGSPEHRKAAEYVAGAFRRAGLVPAGTDGWFQPVRFQVRRIAEGRSSLALVRGARAESLELGKDATINLRSSSAGKVDSPLVFIGYGVRSPEHGHDDLAGLDVKGKVAVVLAGAAPRGIPGPALAAGRAAAADALHRGGAAGVLTIYSPHPDIPWDRYALARLHPQMRPASDSTAHTGGSTVTVVLNPARAERLFSGSRRSYTSVQALADSGASLPRFDLPARLRVTVAVDESESVSDNVVGLLPGDDRLLKMEYVDQFSFICRGIPALSLKVGFAVGSPEHDRVLRWRQERYHGVEDEVTQSVDRQAAEDFNRLYPEVVTEVANRPARPAWYPTSVFRPEATGSR